MKTNRESTANPRSIGRLTLYLRLLQELETRGVEWVYSRELAWDAGVTASQVRQDIMGMGYMGSAQHGYEVRLLSAAIDRKLNGTGDPVRMVLLGTGDLGRALLQFFQHDNPHLKLMSAFETDVFLVGESLYGIPVRGAADLAGFVAAEGIKMAVLAVPEEEAQKGADTLVGAGIRSILNFTPSRLHVPDNVYIENADVRVALQRAAYFGRCGGVGHT